MPGWNEIIGHKDIIQYMKQSVREGIPSHAYLFSGPKGVGKNLTADAFAMALQCTSTEEEHPCGHCHACIQASGGNHPDIIHVRHEKPNLISVQEIREQVVEDMAIRPYSGKYKIYLIEDAELMNPQAQNALLKTLEEPPAYGVIILMSAAAETLLQTIRSRCVLLKFRSLPKETVSRFLQERLGQPEEQAEICAAFAQGSPGQAAALIESEEFGQMRKDVADLMKEIRTLGRGELLARLKLLADRKEKLKECLEIAEVWMRDVLVYKAQQEAADLVFKEEHTAIAEQADTCTYRGVELVCEGLLKARDRLNANVSTELVLDLLLLTIKENI